ncbi:hypothetical protein ASE21_16475 [Flavobacterium sp. Root901]|nr:hypothetical protein ASE21_16475 [Flavobacterium sp. Root901]
MDSKTKTNHTMAENNLFTAILNNKIDLAEQLLEKEKCTFEELPANNLQMFYRNILNANAFQFLNALIKEELIETDLYEYDSFKKSVFYNIAKHINCDQLFINSLTDFLSNFKNINDEVSDQTLLGFMLEEEADPEIIRCLINAGCQTNFKNNFEQNLILQVLNKRIASTEKTVSYLNILLENGEDINCKDIEGTTALILAVKNNLKPDITDLLLQHNANPNEQDNKGNTAFYYAAAQTLNLEILQILLEYDSPDFELQNQEKQTIISSFMQIMSGNEREIKILEKLLNAGADLEQSAPYYSNLKSGVDWLSEKNTAVLESVLKSGNLNLNNTDNQGNTLLHKICAFDIRFEKEAAKEVYRKAKLLIEQGADVTITNNNNETPLMLASKDNLKIKTVELLMEKMA